MNWLWLSLLVFDHNLDVVYLRWTRVNLCFHTTQIWTMDYIKLILLFLLLRFFGKAQTLCNVWFLRPSFAAAPCSVPASGSQHVPLSLWATPFSTLPASWRMSWGEVLLPFTRLLRPLSSLRLWWRQELWRVWKGFAGWTTGLSLQPSFSGAVFTQFLFNFFCRNIPAGLSGVLPQTTCRKSKSTPNAKLVGVANWRIFPFHYF